MSENSKNIWNYSQPDFYHFSEDSVALANYVSNEYESRRTTKALDLCAGCGVVGIEIMSSCRHIGFDFCELQQDFKQYIQANLKQAGLVGNIIIDDYRNLTGQYDLIVCNPPYFSSGSGKKSGDLRRQRCRCFEEGDFFSLVQKVRQLLSSQGSAFFICREKIADARLIKDIAGAYLFELD